MTDRLVRRKVDGRCGSFRRRQEKWSEQARDRFPEPSLPVNAHIGGDRSRMTAVDSDSAALQSFCQLSGEQNICELALGIGPDHIVSMVKINVIEMNLPDFMRSGSNIYDSRTSRHPVKKQCGEKEMTKMIQINLV